jgi:hypothetical protein
MIESLIEKILRLTSKRNSVGRPKKSYNKTDEAVQTVARKTKRKRRQGV